MKKLFAIAIVAFAMLAGQNAFAAWNTHDANVTPSDPVHTWVENGKVIWVQCVNVPTLVTWQDHKRGDGWHPAGPYTYYLGGVGVEKAEWHNRATMPIGVVVVPDKVVKFVFDPCGPRVINIIVDGSDGSGWTDAYEGTEVFYTNMPAGGTDSGYRADFKTTGVAPMGGIDTKKK